MSSARALAVIACLATFAAAPAPAAAQDAATRPSDVDTFEEAVRQTRERTSEQRPRPTTQVAVLHLTLDAQAGELRGAEVDRIEVVSANPPKVFARSRGSWEVRLQGRQQASYRIPNPLEDVEIENPPDARSPYSRVELTGAVPFELIVPLSRDGNSLGVERIQVVDTDTGRVVVDTPVRR